MRAYAVVLILLVLLIPRLSVAATQEFGFVEKNLWFSTTAPVEWQVTRIYTALYNSSEHELRVTMVFFDNDKEIGNAEIAIRNGGELLRAEFPWIPKAGTHTITAEIKNPRLVKNGKEEAITLPPTKTGSRKIDVLTDTDRDGIPDTKDADDDNDGIKDDAEKKAGTDPLIKNALVKATTTLETSTSTAKIATKEKTRGIVNKIKKIERATNDWREEEKAKVSTALETQKKEIESSGAKGISSVTKSPLNYLAAAGLWSADKILSRQSIFLFASAVVLFLILRWIARRFS